jgi:hypothetical protein
MGATAVGSDGFEDPFLEPDGWNADYFDLLEGHEAIRQHGKGVDPDDLADYIGLLGDFAAERVKGIGADQYGGRLQRFETKSLEDLRRDALEEAADLVAYAAMILIKIGAMK